MMSLLDQLAETNEQARTAALQKYRAMIEADDADVAELQSALATLGLTQADLAADIAAHNRIQALQKNLRTPEEKKQINDDAAKAVAAGARLLRGNLKAWIDVADIEGLIQIELALGPYWDRNPKVAERHRDYVYAIHRPDVLARQAISMDGEARVAIQAIRRENPRLFDSVIDAE